MKEVKYQLCGAKAGMGTHVEILLARSVSINMSDKVLYG